MFYFSFAKIFVLCYNVIKKESSMLNQFVVKYLQGLMASGKSTISNKFLKDDPGAVRVNKDEIRNFFANHNDLEKFFDETILKRMMYMDAPYNGNSKSLVKQVKNALLAEFTGKNAQKLLKTQKAKSFGPKEKWTIKIQTCILQTFVRENVNCIIIDDTNYNNGHLTRIKNICDRYTFEMIDMHRDYGVTLQQCIERNEIRANKVPKVAIYAMNKKYHVMERVNNPENCEVFDYDGDYVVADLDGTLAECEHRMKYIDGTMGGKKNWKPFFDGMADDTVMDGTKQLLELTYEGHPVVFVTGRPNNYRSVTEKWLKDNDIQYDALYMRPQGDFRPDTVVKQEIIDLYLDKNKIVMWLDDSPQIIEQVRKNGINTLKIGYR